MPADHAPAPGTRTIEALPPVPEPILAALAEAGAPFDLADAVPEPQDAPPLRWGIIGAGGIAGTFYHDAQAWSSARVVAVASRDRDRARAFIDAHPLDGIEPARALGSYEELVADPEVEAVYVATPHAFHAEHARLALEAGKPVLVEKAFTRNAVEARAVLDLARERGTFAMEAMWTRFLPGQVLARHLLASGLIGEPRLVRADHYQPISHVPRLARPELAGGALLDLGVYPVSWIHSLLGAPERVDAVGRLTDAGVDLDEVITLSYPRATGVAASGMDARSATSGEVDATAGRISLAEQFYRPAPMRVVVDGEGWQEPRVDVVWDSTLPGGFQLQAAEVARCVAAGRTESATVPWSTTLEVMEILDAVRAAVGVRYPGE